MNEKEKMLSGYLYNPFEAKDLADDRIKCKTLCHEYNQLSPADTEKRKLILKQILCKTEGNYWIEQPFYCDYGYNIEIGENFYMNHNSVILDCAKVKFGKNVFIAPFCGFYTAGHAIDTQDRIDGLEYAFPITIGDNVWIGGHVCVMPGVTIGDNSIIGAGSVVTKDIPSNVIAAGNPCKVLREITPEDKNKYRKYKD